MIFRLMILLLFVLEASAKTYAEYVAMLQEDPGVRIYAEKQRAYLARMEASAALNDPQIIVGIDNLPVEHPSFNRYLPTAKVIGVNQRLSIGRQEAAEMDRVLSRRMALQATYEHRRLEALFYTALVKYALLGRQLDNLNGQGRIIDRISDVLDARLNTGEDVVSERSRMSERRLEIEDRILQVRSERLMAANALHRLVGDIPAIKVPRKVLKPWNERQLFPIHLAKNARQQAEANRQSVAAKNGVEFAMQLLYKQREAGATFDGEDWVSVRGVMTVPLWGKTDAAYQTALLQRQAVDNAWLSQRRTWTEMMKNFDARYGILDRRIALLERKIALQTETADALRRRYDAGRGTYESLLESRLRQLASNFALLALKAEIRILAAEQNSHIME